jgi:hypothetical protein
MHDLGPPGVRLLCIIVFLESGKPRLGLGPGSTMRRGWVTCEHWYLITDSVERVLELIWRMGE